MFVPAALVLQCDRDQIQALRYILLLPKMELGKKKSFDKIKPYERERERYNNTRGNLTNDDQANR